MIDLQELGKRAEGHPAALTLVTKRWLSQVQAELQDGREAQARLGQCFGLAPGEKL